jgi:uncharacterized protein YqjF (DUF2071 family)
MPSLSPDEQAWPPVLKAGWLQQTFLHWPVRPADVQVLLPPGLLVDEYDGIWFLIYSGTRRGGAPSYHLVLRPGDPIQPSDRDIWLTGRWRAYTRRFGILFETPVEHEPWPLAAGVVEELTETLVHGCTQSGHCTQGIIANKNHLNKTSIGFTK